MSSDESSDDYESRRGRRGAAKKGRRAKRSGLNDLGASTSSMGGPSRVKLKVKAGGAITAGKKSAKGGYTITSATGKDANVPPQWQGFADRELDSDTEEPLVFEEAFMLRMPVPTNAEQEKELERFSDMVKKREPMDEKDVWFKFLDSRRAVFNLNQTMYNAKLVDLPCLIESQKTNDDKHLFKTADISQMLLVEHQIPNEQAAVSSDKPFNFDDYIYPHGISAPLRNVRKRRFKPKINKQAIEIVERQVERLVEQDEDADEVKYEMVDESEIQEGEQLRTQQEYMAEFAGVDMSLDPALMGALSAGNMPVTGAAEIHQATVPSEVPTVAAAQDEASSQVVEPAVQPLPSTSAMNVDGEVDAEGEESGDDDDDEDDDEEDGEDEEGEERDADGYDSDLAAMIEGEIGGGSRKTDAGQAAQTTASASAQPNAGGESDGSAGSDDDDSDDLFGKGRSDDDEEDQVLGDATVKDNEETLEAKRRIRLMADEMKDLENAVNRKKQEVSRAPNPIIKRRFEDSLKKLSQELDMKKAQHLAAQNKLQHFQNEIKKADAAEKEAAMAPPPGSEPTAGPPTSSRSDPAVVFGEKRKTTEKAATSQQRQQEDDMQIDRSSPPAAPTKSQPIEREEDNIAVGGGDDIQVSVDDFAVPQERSGGDISDLFGDDPDE